MSLISISICGICLMNILLQREFGISQFYNRTIDPDRRDFLLNFAKAQMVVFEATADGVSNGWMYWNFKIL